MKFGRIFAGVLLLGCLVPAVLAQDTNPELKAFTGSWISQFEGKTFVTLKLNMRGGSLTGTMTGASVHIDATGSLTAAEPKANLRQVFDAHLQDGLLQFKTKEGESNPVEFEMKLDGADNGELTLKVPPRTGAPVPKPWKITREGKTVSLSN
jgi:hypothetical protein